MLILKNEDASVIKTEENGIEIIQIDHPNCQAKVSLYGGQVLSWQPHSEEDVLWMSNDAKFEKGSAIRGGIPLCWPWFGGWKTHGNHGFARQSQWQLEQTKIDNDKVVIVLSLAGENAHQNWPHPFKLKQTLVFSQSFSQVLTFTNLAEQAVEFSGALHSYLAVENVADTRLPELAELPFDCKLSQTSNNVRALESAVGPFDRIYQSNKQQCIVDTQRSRVVVLTSEGCQQWVVWNPGKETSESMSDMHSGAEQEFVCVEAANTDWVTVSAGESATMSQRIHLEAINKS